MTGSELSKEIVMTRTPEQLFIKWWRKENDFADYQLLEDFIDTLEPGQEFGGYELLDMEQMWNALERHGHGKVSRERRTSGEHLVWQHDDDQGHTIVDDYPWTPSALMTVFDGETRGDVIC